jgi:hypothetical protein
VRLIHQFYSIAAALAAVVLPGIAYAQETGVVYAGGSVGNGFNTYAGGVVALPGASLGHGLALRGGASGGRYEYVSAAQAIEGKYISGEVALVYQSSGPWGWANFSAGPRVSDTSLTPDDPANELRGTQWDAALQSDGALGDHWRLEWFASAGVFNSTYNSEARFGRLVSPAHQTRLGVETGVQGDESYTKGKFGLFASTLIAHQLQARLSGGLTVQDNRDAEPYSGISLSRTF